ncbi:MAG: RNA chaperone Hfq, partial [Candidatus Muiribacteriota bacterium]
MTDKVFSTKIQDHIINSARKKKIPLTVFLKNGTIYKGTVESFDQFTLQLSNKKNMNSYSLIYKSSILTI